MSSVPPIGPAEIDFLLELHDHSLWEVFVTRCFIYLPSFSSFILLWILLFAGIIAPLGCVLLIQCAHPVNPVKEPLHTHHQLCKPLKENNEQSEIASRRSRHCMYMVSLVGVLLTVVTCSLLILVDDLYMHEFGVVYGLFAVTYLYNLSHLSVLAT